MSTASQWVPRAVRISIVAILFSWLLLHELCPRWPQRKSFKQTTRYYDASNVETLKKLCRQEKEQYVHTPKFIYTLLIPIINLDQSPQYWKGRPHEWWFSSSLTLRGRVHTSFGLMKMVKCPLDKALRNVDFQIRARGSFVHRELFQQRENCIDEFAASRIRGGSLPSVCSDSEQTTPTDASSPIIPSPPELP